MHMCAFDQGYLSNKLEAATDPVRGLAREREKYSRMLNSMTS
jgi:hypothetical protein